MPHDNLAAWDKVSAAYQEGARLPTTVAHYGPDIPTEAELHLLGDVKGKRILELGCGGAQCSIAFVKQGAIAIGVDFSARQLAYARALAQAEEVRVDLREGDLADLAFLSAESIDTVFSANALQYVDDLGRTFRQVHRVLKNGAPFVFSVPHPAYGLIDDRNDAAPTVTRSYFDPEPVEVVRYGVAFSEYPHTFSELYMNLVRASFRVDQVLEPAPLANAPRSSEWRASFTRLPPTLVIRARKVGA